MNTQAQYRHYVTSFLVTSAILKMLLGTFLLLMCYYIGDVLECKGSMEVYGLKIGGETLFEYLFFKNTYFAEHLRTAAFEYGQN